MSTPLIFTRQHFASYLACKRQFQLRYLEAYPWPAPPPTDVMRLATWRGQQFHQMAQRHFLELPVAVPGGDAVLDAWWRSFLQMVPALPAGRRLPELTLTVPIGDHLLSGRVDLLLLADDGAAHIFDWKTGALPAAAAPNWQSRLYPALVVAAGTAIHPLGAPIEPANVTLTYWSPQTPAETRRFTYSPAQHRENWEQLTTLVDDIDAALPAEGIWPLTTALQTCSRCLYRVLCGRQTVAPAALTPDDDEEPLLAEETLTPHLP